MTRHRKRRRSDELKRKAAKSRSITERILSVAEAVRLWSGSGRRLFYSEARKPGIGNWILISLHQPLGRDFRKYLETRRPRRVSVEPRGKGAASPRNFVEPAFAS